MNRIPLGDIMVTPGALAVFEESGASPELYLERHALGDWGDIPQSDASDNDEALKRGECIISVYSVNDDMEIWIVTDRERSTTGILTLEDYDI